MCRGGRHDLEATLLLKLAEHAEQVAVPLEETVATMREVRVIKLSQSAPLLIFTVALYFAAGQLNQPIEVPNVTLPQELILQHRAEGGCDRHGQLERHLVADEPLHHFEQREVAFGDGFEEPIFLHEFVVLRMPDERQMRVKNEREVTSRHCRFQNDDCRLSKDDAVAQS